MPEIRELCDRIEAKIAQIREKASARKWAGYSRHGFVANLEAIIPEMQELHSLFQISRNEIEKRLEPTRPELGEHLKELNMLITVLKRNREMEEARIGKMREQGINALAESVTVPDLYSDLEQKVLSTLLKSMYMAERMRVFDRRRQNPAQSKGAQRTIFELLEKKEREIDDLRQKYEETRNKTFLGLLEKENSIQVENELNQLGRSLEGRTAITKKMFESTKEAFESLQRQMQEIEERVSSIDDTESQITGKTFELITMLKKERDYAKKILIEIEHDTIQLRNNYSKELLALQEEKASLRASLEEKYGKEAQELKRELWHRNENLKHLHESLSAREKKLSELEEENHRLRLVNKTLAKHEKVKKAFKGNRRKNGGDRP
ncbi:MAG: hypothetical protein HY544_02530 [Candidatus Diapherotrites archaeon]|uniref:Uncharacterized protein n=1 Tax=Candidatus Iainarchaeum sp. TaxID=3101447 RepID=A0A8T3YKZ1_9ARCH|nr:hypothetical protein [Candidatus Diapherotrites archaeon]